VTDFRNFRPKKEEEEVLKKRMINRLRIRNQLDASFKEVTITAWYTRKFLLVKDQKDIGFAWINSRVNDGKPQFVL
jgi:hypothetical protein